MPSLTNRAPFFAWPGGRHLLYAASVALANGVWFVLVFAGCDYITRHHGWRVRIHLAGETSIPFVAPMTAIYTSMFLLFIAGPFILRTRREFREVITALALTIGIAGVCFLLIPGELAYPPISESDLGIWSVLYHLSDELNLTYNLVPSLHVALSVVCVAAFARHTQDVGRALLWLWAGAIALSTLLTHQHHVVDVVSGWLLGLFCFRLVTRTSLGVSLRLPAAGRGR